jgi:hypothetical protein
MRAGAFRAAALRLRRAFRQLTNSPRQETRAPSESPIRDNVEHCRALLLVDGICDEPQRQLIEALLRHMETATVGSATDSAQLQDGLLPPEWANDKRLYIVARELIRGRGLQTVSYLRELADMAIAVGDQRSAQACSELAYAADRIFQIASREE